MDKHVVWFRRDLRLHDHGPLSAALASGGPVLPLFIFDPEEWAQPGRAGRQFEYLVECLLDLEEALQKRRSSLCVRTGPALRVLADLHQETGIASLHLHEAVGDAFMLERDQTIRRWALKAGVAFREQSGSGLWASPGPEGQWASFWSDYVTRPKFQAPQILPAHGVRSDHWPEPADMKLPPDPPPGRERGGRGMARLTLQNFLSGRGRAYRDNPATLAEAVSVAPRLSAHIAAGSVSIREIWQAAEHARISLQLDGDQTFATALARFQHSLREQCRARQNLRLSSPRRETSDPAKLAAWARGATGFPFADAAMRAAMSEGWLNGKTCAFLLQFATRQLWLEERTAANRLAAHFTDLDPIFTHMSETAGRPTFNSVRRSRELDPDGQFIGQWIPELRALPDRYIHAPWDTPKSILRQTGIVLGQDYPMPLVDPTSGFQQSRRHSPAAAPARKSPRQMSFDFADARAL